MYCPLGGAYSHRIHVRSMRCTNLLESLYMEKVLIRCLRVLHLIKPAYALKEFLYQFLRVDCIRAAIAALRYFYFVVIRRRFRILEPGTADVNANAVSHNRRHMKGIRGFAVIRSSAL